MKSITTSFLGIAAALLASSAPSFAQIWQQDAAFAPVIVRETDATTHLSATADAANRFLINGGGWSPFTHVNGVQVWGLSRLLANGSIDASLPPTARSSVPNILGLTSDGGAWVTRTNYTPYYTEVIPVEPRTTIQRLRADGSVDPAVAEITLETYFSGTLVLPDDSLVVYGFGLSTIAGSSPAGIARFYPNGLRDPAYAPTVQTETMGVQRAFLDGEGRVLVWRRKFVQGTYRHDLLRLTTNGVIDPTFTWQLEGVAIDAMELTSNRVIVGSGKELRAYDFSGQLRNTSDLAASVPSQSWNSRDLRTLPDGRTLLHVTQYRSSARASQHLVRLNPDLSIERTWPASLGTPAFIGLLAIAPNGTMLLREETEIDAPQTSPSRLVLATDDTWQVLAHTFTRRDPGTVQQVHDLDAGGITVWGDFTHIDGQARDGGARFLADGSLDATFAPARVSPFLPLRDGGVIALQTLSPTVWGGGTTHLWVRVGANGEVQPVTAVPATLPFSPVRWLAEADDGRILYSWFDNEAELARLAWLSADGSTSTPLSATFTYATERPLYGITLEAIWNGQPTIVTDNLVTGATLLEDGSMLISTGYLAKLEGQTGLVFRLNADGTADSAFTLQPPAAFVTRNAAFTREGKIVLQGQLSNDLTRSSVAVRLHADGTLDTSFAPLAELTNLRSLLRSGRSMDGSVLLGADGWPEPVLAADSSRAFLSHAAIDQNDTLWGEPGPDSTVAVAAPAPPTFPTTYATLHRFTLATDSSLITSPADRSVIAGQPVSFSVGLADPSNATVQWFKDNAPLAGATSPHLELTSPSIGDAGNYHAVVTYPNTSYTSAAALTVTPNTTRLTNFSARSHITPDQPQYGGFVTDGPADRPLLIRSIGSGLNGLGITNTALLPDPALSLHQGNTVIASDFGGVLAPAITALAARLGAFPIVPVADNVPVDPVHGSALAPTVAATPYSAQVVSHDNLSGVALLEIYDAGEDQTRALRNVSLRAATDTGNRVLIGGFVLQGNGPSRVLIRAIGPGLANFGVPAPLADPVLKLYRYGYERAANDDWAGDAAITAAAETVGAFPLPASSNDAALLMTLPPGAYTAQVHLGKEAAPGEALLEIYVIQPLP